MDSTPVYNQTPPKQKCAVCFNVFIVAIVLFFVLLAGMFFYTEGRLRGIIGPTGVTISPAPSATPTSATPLTSPTPSPLPHADMIHPTAPKPGDLVKSPLTVTGEARGMWFFEASFPVRLLDANGKQIAIAPAQAEGEWMTENFVPYKVVLEFNPPSTDTGTLVLEKDNPSGLPEHAAEVIIPVRFR